MIGTREPLLGLIPMALDNEMLYRDFVPCRGARRQPVTLEGCSSGGLGDKVTVAGREHTVGARVEGRRGTARGGIVGSLRFWMESVEA